MVTSPSTSQRLDPWTAPMYLLIAPARFVLSQTERTPTSSLDYRNSTEVFILLDASHIPQLHNIQPSQR